MLSRRFRLKHRADFNEIRSQGRKVVGSQVILIYIKHRDSGQAPKIGFSAGKRIGNAVKRNRAKRLVREAVKEYLASITPGSLCLFIVRHRINDATLEEVTRTVEKLLKNARLIEHDVD